MGGLWTTGEKTPSFRWGYFKEQLEDIKKEDDGK